jgi:hypothetical protein
MVSIIHELAHVLYPIVRQCLSLLSVNNTTKAREMTWRDLRIRRDGWDEPAEPWKIGGDMEPDEFGHFQPVLPVHPGGGAAGGGTGGGTAPV